VGLVAITVVFMPA